MYDFEKTEISFTYEKNKEMQLGRLEVILRKRAMPDEYVRLCHNFLVGCFWIKFAPI